MLRANKKEITREQCALEKMIYKTVDVHPHLYFLTVMALFHLGTYLDLKGREYL